MSLVIEGTSSQFSGKQESLEQRLRKNFLAASLEQKAALRSFAARRVADQPMLAEQNGDVGDYNHYDLQRCPCCNHPVPHHWIGCQETRQKN